MKKNDIFRQAAQHEMPDIEQVRKECIEELHTTHSSKRYPAYFAAIAVVTVVVLCMCITTVRSFAADMIEHIQALIDVNNDSARDLVYRKYSGPTVYLEKDETVSIYSYTGYEDVYILPAEAKEAEKLGAISRDVKVSYKVPYSGEYYILDGENKENITDRVIVEHEGGAEDNLKISQ